MSRSFIEKAVQYLVIALLPTLFLMGYLQFGVPQKPKIAQLTSAAFISEMDSAMVPVTGGNFNIGSNTLSDKEKPEHQVEVSSFYISKTTITVRQFSFFITVTGYKTTAEKDSGSCVFNGTSWTVRKGVNWRCDESGALQSTVNNNKPVLYISWYDAQAFCTWLSKISGKDYRLPTEAEWEFAAKGGILSKGYLYSGGNDPGIITWNGINSGLKVHPVAEKKPNELGLYDMSGNVWQWCSDWYNEKYYANSPAINPQGPQDGLEKICHGGSYLSGSGIAGDSGLLDQLKPESRGKEFPYISAGDGSFRIALSQPIN